jgi:signal transduction histidine kinase
MATLRNIPATTDFAEPRTLLSYIQAKVERDKVELGRVLHDELGGLLVAAHMDASWAEQHLGSGVSDQVRSRLQRARSTLATAIDMKRKLIEDLYPTLLGNVGLFAALSWQFKHSCELAHLRCSAHVPTRELPLSAETSIALFRIVEEALHLITAHKDARSIDLDVTVDYRRFCIALSHDGMPIAERDRAEVPAFASMQHRVWNLHGSVDLRSSGDRTTIGIVIPMAAIMPAEPRRKSHDDGPRVRIA